MPDFANFALKRNFDKLCYETRLFVNCRDLLNAKFAYCKCYYLLVLASSHLYCIFLQFIAINNLLKFKCKFALQTQPLNNFTSQRRRILGNINFTTLIKNYMDATYSYSSQQFKLNYGLTSLAWYFMCNV